jgi:hypothetical protein
MAVTLQSALLVITVTVLGLAGCQQDERPKPLPPKTSSSHAQPVKKEATVLVPSAVVGKWKSVSIAVIDKSNISQKRYTIPIGGSLSIPSTALTIEVESFLPAFIMEGTTMTSSSNELTNPGAKVKISENGAVIFKGWLFSKFPNTHAFMHPKYGFTLMDVTPAGK